MAYFPAHFSSVLYFLGIGIHPANIDLQVLLFGSPALVEIGPRIW